MGNAFWSWLAFLSLIVVIVALEPGMPGRAVGALDLRPALWRSAFYAAPAALQEFQTSAPSHSQ